MNVAGRQRARAPVRLNQTSSASSRQRLSATSFALDGKPDPSRLTPAALLALQASAGNHAVQRLLAESRNLNGLSLQRDNAGAATAPSPPAAATSPAAPPKRHDYVFIM